MHLAMLLPRHAKLKCWPELLHKPPVWVPELEGTTTDGRSAHLKITGIASGVGAHADLLYYAIYASDGP
ncbi:MAG: hypothetical protein AAFZ18_39305, partial [Myxococcota bacterium]